jgi:hypothetical protein
MFAMSCYGYSALQCKCSPCPCATFRTSQVPLSRTGAVIVQRKKVQRASVTRQPSAALAVESQEYLLCGGDNPFFSIADGPPDEDKLPLPISGWYGKTRAALCVQASVLV